MVNGGRKRTTIPDRKTSTKGGKGFLFLFILLARSSSRPRGFEAPCSVDDAWLGGAEWYVAWRLVWILGPFWEIMTVERHDGGLGGGRLEGRGGIGNWERGLRAWSFGRRFRSVYLEFWGRSRGSLVDYWVRVREGTEGEV